MFAAPPPPPPPPAEEAAKDALGRVERPGARPLSGFATGGSAPPRPTAPSSPIGREEPCGTHLRQYT